MPTAHIFVHAALELRNCRWHGANYIFPYPCVHAGRSRRNDGDGNCVWNAVHDGLSAVGSGLAKWLPYTQGKFSFPLILFLGSIIFFTSNNKKFSSVCFLHLVIIVASLEWTHTWRVEQAFELCLNSWGEPQAGPTVTCWLGFLSWYTRSLVTVETPPPLPASNDRLGTETAVRLDQRKHFRKSKHLLRSEVNWCDLHLRRSTWHYTSE